MNFFSPKTENSIDLPTKINKLPASPGVYLFYGKNSRLLYVGKAANLKSRVRSYFGNKKDGRLIGNFVHEIKDVKTRETDSVLEALILEARLIKKFQPEYNVSGKDDKSFSFIAVTREEYPRVFLARETELLSARGLEIKGKKIPISRAYGPYVSKKQAQIALKIMRKIFPFHANNEKTEKGCLDFQIGLCPGPYADAITREDYLKNIRSLIMILEGKKKSLIKKLEREMRRSSSRREYEKAGETRNKIFALKHIQDVALISAEQIPFQRSGSAGEKSGKKNIFRVEAYDVSNISGQYAVGGMVVFQSGQANKNEYRKFKIRTASSSDDVGMTREVLRRRFQNAWPRPNLILLDGGQGHLSMGERVLKEFGLRIPLAAVAKGPTRKNLEIRISNFKPSSAAAGFLDDRNLVKKIMDEAHRFAIDYHRRLRKKNWASAS